MEESEPVTVQEAGVNVVPGSSDDGWETPPRVQMDDGTSIQLYKDGEALKAAFAAIENAQNRVCLESYIFASDDTGRAFAELLCKKASQGINVYVIYDSVGSYASDREMFRQMKRAGVRVEEFHPMRPWECRCSWRPFNRDHRKLLVIDNDIAGMGGLNVGAEYAGSWVIRNDTSEEDNVADFWRDTAIGITGPGARHFLRCFAKSWHYVTHGGRIRTTEFDYGTESIGQPFRGNDLSILASVPARSSPLRSLLHTILGGARHRIDMTMAYFAPDDDLVATLCRAARRGVKIRLMLPSKTDVQILMIAARSYYETLLSAGIEIYERRAVVLHAKTMAIDDKISVVGSLNLDYRSIEYNLELSAIIRSEQFGRQLHALFDNDVNFADRINLKEWRRRPVWDRIVQWTVSRARYLL